ncbi:hypothetical protein Pcinc_031501 [Petrolisthes cinctipes]|uniref:Peptidyl-prolyl cis-trans isomerase n=1 Tax=Petrolisthes cinctipes TaxID=88211 RepID=A0AAE1K2I6_PETCI|nr:hypothetical protein Pcinc_031501 [Petrolisthes cinctipes]
MPSLIHLYYYLSPIQQTREFKVTHEAYLDIEIDGEPMGKIVVGLFGDAVPKTVANFLRFAARGYKGHHYKGSPFHRIIKKFMIQAGDVLTGDGKGSISIYGPSFPDENFEIKHSGPGFLSMANRGKDTNGCQFFITTIATPWLDGHHVVFGKVVKGQAVLHKIEYTATDWNDRPLKEIIIAKSGRQPLDEPYYISDDPYNLRDWLKTISFPLGLSFSIICIFNHFIKKLDSHILDDDGSMDDEETVLKKKMIREEEEEKEKGKEEEKGKEKNEEDKEINEKANVRKRAVEGDDKK